MNILFLGDVIGKPGRDGAAAELPALKRALKLFTLALGVTALSSGLAFAGEILDKIKKDGVIKVGVAASPGFSSPDSNGKWQGFFVDFGRAPADGDFFLDAAYINTPAEQGFDIAIDAREILGCLKPVAQLVHACEGHQGVHLIKTRPDRSRARWAYPE